jgi:hypothetical protein
LFAQPSELLLDVRARGTGIECRPGCGFGSAWLSRRKRQPGLCQRDRKAQRGANDHGLHNDSAQMRVHIGERPL